MRKSVLQQMDNNNRDDDDDDDDEAAPLSSSARVAVAQICQSMRFKGAQKSALKVLTDVATMYLKAIAKLGAASANSNGLEDLGSVQGFAGSSTLRETILVHVSRH
ncbi:hypothetical protein MIMGU_mgv11b023610mg [Erythranthe guttata]|uniref:Bromodomain associated domain-containing protein n=1 Tax=Erythranthe guttata TaxID=4155 RepID=A0A022QP12_ERYGU|nr:hypothetical protein MIMGU_mgv11b023610mg [Erythranthe guttata]